MAISKVLKVIELDIHSAGNINYRGSVDRHDGYGFDADEINPRYARDLKSTVIVTEHGTLISREICKAIADDTDWQPSARIGGRHYMTVTQDFLLEALLHNEYPARNEREQQCRDRNRAIVDYLLSFIS